MATRTVSKFDPTFTAAIARVQPALEDWRQRSKHREPIPPALWKAMAALARTYGLSPVAHALNVNYTALKRRVVADGGAPPSGAGAVPAAFLEVPVKAWPQGPQGPQWVLELEDRCGSKLTLRLAQNDGAAALALAQGLWGNRA
jgi:hypothetical protein